MYDLLHCDKVSVSKMTHWGEQYHIIIKHQEVLDKPAHIQLVHDGCRACGPGFWNLSHDHNCGLDHYMGLLCLHAHLLHKLYVMKMHVSKAV